jgi:hypothetical protein
LPAGKNGSFVNTPVWSEAFTYAWTKTDDAGYSATNKNISGLSTGEYNLTVSNGLCSHAKSFTVNSTNPVFTAGAIQTNGETICNGGDPGIIGNTTVASGGDGAITYEWRADGISISGTNSATYDPPTGLATTTTYTRWARDNTCNTIFAQSAGNWMVTVDPLPSITTQPQPLTLCEGESGNFSVVTSSALPSYQWQYSNNTAGPWTNTDGVAGVAGHTSDQLSLINTPVGYSNFYVSCFITSNGCSVRTNAVLLIVNPLPATGEIIPD